MSNIVDGEVVLDGKPLEDLTEDLREDNFVPKTEKQSFGKSFVKPPIQAPLPTQVDGAFTAEQVIAMSKIAEQQARKAIREAVYDVNMSGQVLPKDKVVITDFSKMSLDDVYNLDIPIEAKPFMSADVLRIVLKDTNYEARWVNINPQNLGDKIAKGFTYIVPNDLSGVDDSIKASKDAEGHYRFNDVVAMKIDKATYFAALRAAHLRAISTTNSDQLMKKARTAANSYMMQESGAKNDYVSAANAKKMVFYDPGVEV